LLARANAPLTTTGVTAAIGYSKGEIFRMLQVLGGARLHRARTTRVTR